MTLEHLFFFFYHLSLVDFFGACIICMSDDGWDVCIETNMTVNNAP